MDEEAIHKVVIANINIRIAEEGEKIKKLVEIAQDKNIDYKPSNEALVALRDYCDRKGIENPLSKGRNPAVVEGAIPPPYNPNMGMELHPSGGLIHPMQQQYPSYMHGNFQPIQPGMEVIGAPVLDGQNIQPYQY
jgi:hypothetical protein